MISGTDAVEMMVGLASDDFKFEGRSLLEVERRRRRRRRRGRTGSCYYRLTRSSY